MPGVRVGWTSSQPSQASFPREDHAPHGRLRLGSEVSSSVKPEPSGLSVAGRPNPFGLLTHTRILLPPGAKLGQSAAPGRSCTSCVPSGLMVKIWKPSTDRLYRPKRIRPFRTLPLVAVGEAPAVAVLLPPPHAVRSTLPIKNPIRIVLVTRVGVFIQASSPRPYRAQSLYMIVFGVVLSHVFCVVTSPLPAQGRRGNRLLLVAARVTGRCCSPSWHILADNVAKSIDETHL